MVSHNTRYKMPYSDPEKQKAAMRKIQNAYAKRKKAEIEQNNKELARAEHTTKLLLKRLKSSEDELKEVQNLMEAKLFDEARKRISFLLYQQREKQQFEIQQFKNQLMKKYVCSDPEYQKLTQEGQYFYERSFLAFLDFLHATHTLEIVRQKEDEGILSQIDVYHKKEAKEIMGELDQFLNKYLTKSNSEVQKEE